MEQTVRAPIEDSGLGHEFEFTREDFDDLAALIHGIVGIRVPESKRTLVYTRLTRRLRELGFSRFADYRHLLTQPDGREEIERLVNRLTTNHTGFFREKHHIEHFDRQVLRPCLEARRSDACGRLRVWSSACSTGEEPYSIALQTAATLQELGRTKGHDIKILATDIDTQVLETARNGVYPADSVAKIPSSLRRYLRSVDGGEPNAIVPSVKEMITFKRLNLLEDWPMQGPFDAIFCRNVMIYFDAQTKDKLIRRFVDLLDTDGVLYIGHSERIEATDLPIKIDGTTIYRKLS